MRKPVRWLNLAVPILGMFLLTNCTAKNGGTSSNVSITFPDASVMRSDGSSAKSYDFSLACFAVNVTASDITPTKKNSCSIPIGVFGGFVAPGGALALSVPRGTARSLSVFVYQRASAAAPCPVQTDFGTVAPNKLVRVGTVASFDAQTDTVNLTVNLTNPATTDNLISQYALATSCSQIAPPPSSAAFTDGHVNATGGAYKMSASVADHKNAGTLTGGTFKIQLLRKPASN